MSVNEKLCATSCLDGQSAVIENGVNEHICKCNDNGFYDEYNEECTTISACTSAGKFVYRTSKNEKICVTAKYCYQNDYYAYSGLGECIEYGPMP